MKITVKYADGRLLVGLNGELDHHSAKSVMQEITEAIETTLPRELLLDFGKLGFMDSSGIAVIVKAKRRMSESGGRLVIVDPQPQPRKVIEAAGIDRLAEIRTKWEVTT